ncbi:hypothetical protein AB1Y20_017706 [Prymnesium parvum]|uniref:Intraflagellar transport protein 122 homolog n=1 Tax=Prymnesium parvum TaxID=97485 RepID=A0AB34JNC4_PRYPA
MGITALRGSQTGAIAIAYSSGRVALSSDVEEDDWVTVDAHQGGTLALAFAEPSQQQRGSTLLLSSGADGKVCVWPLSLTSPVRSHALQCAGATTGSYGVVIDNLAADDTIWAVAMARCVVIGWHSDSREPESLPPLAHAIDDLTILGDGTVAAATFGGVTLFHKQHGPTSTFECYARVRPLPAAPQSGDVTLGFNGWARSLCASPNGAWLASHAAASGREKPSLWLWRTSDGADFECRGLGCSIAAMCWSPASDLLATWAGSTLSILQFGSRGPAGTSPLRHSLAEDEVVLVATFDPSGKALVCGTERGLLVTVDMRHVGDATAQRSMRIDTCRLLYYGGQKPYGAPGTLHSTGEADRRIEALMIMRAHSKQINLSKDAEEHGLATLLVALDNGNVCAWTGDVKSFEAVLTQATSDTSKKQKVDDQ